MARLIARGERYESVSPGSLFEADYESLLLANAGELYPTSHLVPYKKIVTSEYGSAMPDLALIDRRYRKWWVVEVELSSHSLRDHVEPQVAVLATADYGREDAAYLGEKHQHLSKEALREMMMGTSPGVLVLVNEPCPSWSSLLGKWEAQIGVVEVFRSQTNREVLLIDGDHPEPLQDIVSVCRVDPLMRQSLIIDSPASVTELQSGRLTIATEGGRSVWRRVDSADRVWLMPLRRYPLPTQVNSFLLIRDQEGELSLVPARLREVI